MENTSKNSEPLIFADELIISPDAQAQAFELWNILVVDDESDVHQVTQLSLKGQKIQGKQLALHQAKSSEVAKDLLRSGTEFAVALIDVVMETENAGLDLVQFIREELNNHEIRIILRTGQPGQAPEAEAIANYDINDYRLKTELTRVHLITSLTAALRSYEQIVTINQTRNDLAQIISHSNDLMKETSLYDFGLTVLSSISQLLRIPARGLLACSLKSGDQRVWKCFAADSEYQSLVNTILSPASHGQVIEILERSLSHKAWTVHGQLSSLYLTQVEESHYVCIYHDSIYPGSQKLQSLELLMTSIRVGIKNQALLSHLIQVAWVDSLTNLPNRAKLHHVLESVIMDPTQHDLFILDIDDFDMVNDALGQKVGDAVLISISKRLQNLGSDSLIVARLGGDQFGLLDRSEAINYRQIQAVFNTPVQVDSAEIRINATLGITPHVHQCSTAADALRKAAVALHEAKKTNRGGSTIFDPVMDNIVEDRLSMINQLGNAISQRSLRLFYQPKIDNETLEVAGLEALMRWPVEGGFIPPFKFIPIAETSGLIFSLERFAISQACKDIKQLEAIGRPDLTIAINVSIPVLESDSFFDYCQQVMAKHGIDPQQIMIEITESVMIQNQLLVRDKLAQFRDIGVRCSIDDFGTGYNSLTYLNSLPVDQIKIDKSFIDQIHLTERGKLFSKAIIDLAKAINLELVAEGIEEQAQQDILTELGCDQSQGYLFSRPVPMDELIVWLDSRNQPSK